jgi:menaquinone-9 beta-reductase
MTVDFDVAVVGGGLAGSATALHLARRGHRVVVRERGSSPREKVCGEGLMPHGVAEIAALGLLDAVRATAPVPFHGVRYRIDDMCAEGRFPGGRSGLGLRRARVDAALHRACVDAPGVQVRLGVGVRDAAWSADAVTVATTDGLVRARAVVGADGLSSLIRRKAGLALPPRGPVRYGARLHVRLAAESPRLRFVEVIVEPDLEVYLTPTAPDELNIAVLVGKDVARSLGGDLHGRLMARLARVAALAPHLAGAEVITPAAMWGPLRQRTRAVTGDRVALVGDAAGFVDALTGEGMSLGLVSARLAAETLDVALGADDLRATALRRYDRARRRHTRWPTLLTEGLVRGIRYRGLASWVIAAIALWQELFDLVLGVAAGGAARVLGDDPAPLPRRLATSR